MSLDWKLGVALKSNKCSSLNSAFVTVFLKMINANNEVSSHSFEMTIPEFQVRCNFLHMIPREPNPENETDDLQTCL